MIYVGELSYNLCIWRCALLCAKVQCVVSACNKYCVAVCVTDMCHGVCVISCLVPCVMMAVLCVEVVLFVRVSVHWAIVKPFLTVSRVCRLGSSAGSQCHFIFSILSSYS